MAKKKRTKAQRSAAAKASWQLRKLKGAAAPTPTSSTVIGPIGLSSDVPGYEALALELSYAYAQSSSGKGKERHSNGRPFDRQPILELGRLYGPGFAAGQAAKKTQEALGMLKRGGTLRGARRSPRRDRVSRFTRSADPRGDVSPHTYSNEAYRR